MRRNLGLLAVLAAMVALGGCAFDDTTMPDAQEFVMVQPVDATPPEPRKITRYADENRDGQVTRDEARADPALAARFDEYDLDRNGKLDRGEFARLDDEQASGDFGPERGEPLNRTGGWDESPAETE